MSHRSLLPAALISGLVFTSAAHAGHSDPTVRLGVDVIWGGGHIYPAPVVWYPAPAYSYVPPPPHGRDYRADRHGHHHHHRHAHRHEGGRGRWDGERHDRRHHDD